MTDEAIYIFNEQPCGRDRRVSTFIEGGKRYFEIASVDPTSQ